MNWGIRAPEVRVISSDGTQLGVMPLKEAMRIAEEQALDLVEVAANAKPPVCRIMNYGKYKYQQSKRSHDARKHQTVIHVKEVKLRPRTDEHDFEFKLRHAQRFLTEGNKVKVSVLFRGREMAYPEHGLEVINRFIDSVKDIMVVEQPPRLEGRNMVAILTPKAH
ncbi:MAG TPA: translation initiation factor IF-3 [Thermodesulfobacteriota bacterium]|nr:translation initiation factor IF-3 [Thermodesulfobacteriota bacterium]